LIKNWFKSFLVLLDIKLLQLTQEHLPELFLISQAIFGFLIGFFPGLEVVLNLVHLAVERSETFSVLHVIRGISQKVCKVHHSLSLGRGIIEISADNFIDIVENIVLMPLLYVIVCSSW